MIVRSTFILPFYAVYLLYMYKHIDKLVYIEDSQKIKDYQKLYNDKLEMSHIAIHEGWRFAMISYNLFYRYYQKYPINLAHLKMKNDEYPLAYDVYLAIIKYIPSDTVISILMNEPMNKSGLTREGAACMNKLYKLVSPEYLGLDKI